MRGKHVTKPIEMVVAEAEELAADGVRELILVAQDMTYYGLDLYGRTRLAELLREVGKVEGIDWIRILYCYPQFFTDELYDVLSNTPKIIPYLDMPLQHINDRMLKMMNRRHNRQETEAIIARLRATIPKLVLRTTLIVGFPGETEAEFSELLDFVAATRFERLGAFTYSFEPDTPAAKLPDQLPDQVKTDRQARLMGVQQPIAFAFNQSLVGQTLDVLIDTAAPEEKHLWLGRTYTDAPDVDGNTWVRGAQFQPGDLIECEIVAAQGHDLVARPVSNTPPKKRRARPRPRRRPQSALTILDGM
jgi:ribosomal protein S12 methylthiotransferase